MYEMSRVFAGSAFSHNVKALDLAGIHTCVCTSTNALVEVKRFK